LKLPTVASHEVSKDFPKIDQSVHENASSRPLFSRKYVHRRAQINLLADRRSNRPRERSLAIQ
jgi:hypothetical protein